jgi:hypothetical protein
MQKTHRSKLLARVAVAAAVLLAAFWYWSPYWDLRQMAAAARAGDADTFNAHVDYSRLRESVKGQFAAKMAEAMGKIDASNPFSAMGAAIGMGMVNAIVDAMVRPEVVMKAMAEGKLAPQKTDGAPPVSTEGGSKPAEPHWKFERDGVNKIVSYAIDPAHPDAANAQRVGFVFERTGFANWKLTEVRLPKL